MVFLIAFSFLIPAYVGVTGIFWAAPAADIAAGVVTAVVMAGVWNQLRNEERGLSAFRAETPAGVTDTPTKDEA